MKVKMNKAWERELKERQREAVHGPADVEAGRRADGDGAGGHVRARACCRRLYRLVEKEQ